MNYQLNLERYSMRQDAFDLIRTASNLTDLVFSVRRYFVKVQEYKVNNVKEKIGQSGNVFQRLGSGVSNWSAETFSGANLEHLKVLLRFTGQILTGSKKDVISKLLKLKSVKERIEGKTGEEISQFSDLDELAKSIGEKKKLSKLKKALVLKAYVSKSRALGLRTIKETVTDLNRKGKADGSQNLNGLPVNMRYILGALRDNGLISQKDLDALKADKDLFLTQEQYDQKLEQRELEKKEEEKADRLANPEKYERIEQARKKRMDIYNKKVEEAKNRTRIEYKDLFVRSQSAWTHEDVDFARKTFLDTKLEDNEEVKDAQVKIEEITQKIEELKTDSKLGEDEKAKKIEWWQKRIGGKKRIIKAYENQYNKYNKALPEIETLLKKEQVRREALGERFDEKGRLLLPDEIKIEESVLES